MTNGWMAVSLQSRRLRRATVSEARLGSRPAYLDARPHRCVIELAIPIYEPFDTNLDWCRWLELHVLNKRIDVSVRGRYVTGLNVHKSLLRRATECLFENLNEATEFYRRIVADVIEPVRGSAGCGVGISPVP